MKITIEIQQIRNLKDRSEKSHKKIKKLESCNELLELIVEVLETQDPTFHLFGFEISESGEKTITHLLGLSLSITIIFTARKEFEIALEV